MTEQDIIRELEHRYAKPEWIFLHHVRSATGYSDVRTVDGLALNTYPSKSFEIHGFEVKTSRSDWLRELKQPAKADELFGYCDRWFLVIAEKEICPAAELPKGWGLLASGKTGLRVIVQAPLRKSKPMRMALFASILRNATDGMINISTIDQRIQEARADEIGNQKFKIERLEGQVGDLKKVITAFEEGSGVEIERWHGEKDAALIGRALREVLQAKKFRVDYDLDWAIKSMESAVETLKKIRTLTKPQQSDD